MSEMLTLCRQSAKTHYAVKVRSGISHGTATHVALVKHAKIRFCVHSTELY